MTGGGPNGHEPEPEPEAAGLTLADVLEDLAADFPDVQARTDDAGVDYVVGARSFARVVGGIAHFRLRPEIAAAAARTPAVSASPVGPEWVAFSPASLDQYALDRAQSWFELGHRLAAESPGGTPKRH